MSDFSNFTSDRHDNERDAFVHYASANGPLSEPIEMFDLVKGDQLKSKRAVEKAGLGDAFPHLLDAEKWLPFAAEELNISKNLHDYVIVPTSIMPSELPNRNGVGFPYEELSRWNGDTKCLAYQTWRGAPTYLEHANDILKNAKGVILATSLRPLSNYVGNFWHVVNLLSFDRNKDADLVSQILAKKRTSYSMGAYVRDYECSICAKTVKGGGCDHVKRGQAKYSLYGDKDLAYFRALEPVGFETSSVAVPAYFTADNPDYDVMWNQ